MAESGVYLYAIAQDLDPERMAEITGVSGTAVRLISHAGLAAVVSTVPLVQYGEQALRENLEDIRWLEETARTHHAVVAAVADAAPAAPVRLATIFHDDDRVRDLLEEQAATVREALSRVVGHSEWGVKGYSDPDAFQPVPEEYDAAAETGKPGTAYLKQRSSQRRSQATAAQRMADTAEEIHRRLAAFAVATRRHRPQDPRLSGHEGAMVLNTAYLVEDAEAKDFVTAADQLATSATGVRLEVTGPWPAYSFISIEDTG